jgi:hypothetical protein
MRSNRIVFAMCFGVLLSVAVPVRAQWPTVLMFYGGPLKTPIFVTGADSVVVAPAFRPTSGTSSPVEHAGSMGNRPFISVACFWGPPSNPAMNGVGTLADLTPDMAMQHARFYPATATEAAAVFTTSMTTLKGRDVQGALAAAPGAMAIGNVQTKSMRGAPPPAQAAAFFMTGPVPTSAIETLKRLGIPAGP